MNNELTTYKQTKIGIIPNDWEVKRLGDVIVILGGNAFSSTDSQEEGIPWLKIGNVGVNTIKTETIDYLPNSFKKNYKEFLLHKNDYVMALTRPILNGKLKIAKIQNREWLLNQRVAKLTSKKGIINFFVNLLKMPFYCHLIEVLMAGTDPPNLGVNSFKLLKLPIPPLPEQKAIANCLTTWDKGIEKLTALITAKKTQKKALMQSIFNDELRIKNWKEVKLGDIGETFNGLTGKNKNDFGFGKPYVSYLNVFKNSKIDEETDFDFVSISENENQQKLQYGDLIFTTSSETPNEVGMSSVILFEPIEDLFLNSFCFGFRLNDFEILYPNFAIHILREQNFRKEMYRLAQGSTRFNLSKTGFKKIKLKLPTLAEQQEIANLLSTADKEIALLEQKLVALQRQKQGLMQVLLTGQVRIMNQ